LYRLTGRFTRFLAKAPDCDFSQRYWPLLLVVNGEKKADVWSATYKRSNTIAGSNITFMHEKGNDILINDALAT
jgi:hypothetical protein